MKKVLMVASTASMNQQFNMPNIELLKILGYNVEIACNFDDGNTISNEKIIEFKKELEEKKIKYYNLPFVRNPINFQNVRAYNKLKEIIEKNKYEFLHCHTPIGGVVARLVGKATKTKVIYTAHGFHFFKGAPLLNWLIYYPIEKILSKYTDVLITINSEDYELAKNKFYAKKVEYIPGVGVDTEKIAKIEVDKKKKREELGLKEDEIVLLSVGELNKNKNHSIIIEVLSKIKNNKIKYLICGQGSLENFLKEKIKLLNLEENVKLLGYRKDILEICKISDVFIFPSLREGLSVSLMEAMGNGIPIIASNIRGNSDLIKNNENGFLLNNNIEEYVEKIEEIIKDEEKRKNFGKNSLEKIKKFDIKNVEKIMREIYNKI